MQKCEWKVSVMFCFLFFGLCAKRRLMLGIRAIKRQIYEFYRVFVHLLLCLSLKPLLRLQTKHQENQSSFFRLQIKRCWHKNWVWSALMHVLWLFHRVSWSFIILQNSQFINKIFMVIKFKNLMILYTYFYSFSKCITKMYYHEKQNGLLWAKMTKKAIGWKNWWSL